MTKDKLEKEAGESWWNDNNCSGALSTKKIYICGYLAGAEPREKSIAELNNEIAELKVYNEKLLNGDIEKHNKIVELEKENTELKALHESDKRSLRLIVEKGADLELKIKKLTQHLEPQAITALFEQVEEEVKQEQKIKELEEENTKLKEKINYLSEQIQELKIELDTPESVVLDKLDEAKELLKDITSSYGSTEVSEAQLYLKIKRAEQFLGELE